MEEDIKILEEYFKDRMDVEEEKCALKNIIHELEYNKVQFATQLREKLDLRADTIPKSKIKEKIEELKGYRDLAKEQIEEKIIIADTDSLNYGRAEAHDKDIQVLQELMGD